MSESTQGKIAVVLSGGGSRGALQVGALKYLSHKGVPIQTYYGTSIGALNAAGMATVGIDELERIWLNVKSRWDIFSPNWQFLVPPLVDGFYKTKPLRKIIDDILKQGRISKAVVCKVDLEAGAVRYGRSSDPDFADSVHASAAFPLLVSPVKRVMADGGLREMAPLAQAIRDGADRIIAILTAPLKGNYPKWKKPRLFPFHSLTFRVFDIIMHEIMLNDISLCVERNRNSRYRKVDLEVYAPKEHVIGLREFDSKKIKEAIDAGYEMARSGPVLTD